MQISEEISGIDPGEPIRLSDYPMFYFAAIQAQNFRNMAGALDVIGVSPTEWRVLNLLEERPGRTVNDVADLAVIERSKASRAIASLTEKDCIKRLETKKDRRKAELRLTDKGQDLARRAREIALQVYARNLKGLSQEDFDTLMRCLRTIRENTLVTEQYVDIEL
ncbi:MarR family winged helix-turn-helix transcriptional regulator [Pseudooceanicola atlanticus]|uniref:MarR family winged helix-turn-helix transcriptional regulator n=1 Tax=Pseudooceanicola atlanticus TaxID=1461694 RepID=UPI000A5925D0|nr:MarR family winged helix-turn-helix transcriptional regulator [Pseudooceanicola atlanticus]